MIGTGTETGTKTEKGIETEIGKDIGIVTETGNGTETGNETETETEKREETGIGTGRRTETGTGIGKIETGKGIKIDIGVEIEKGKEVEKVIRTVIEKDIGLEIETGTRDLLGIVMMRSPYQIVEDRVELMYLDKIQGAYIIEILKMKGTKEGTKNAKEKAQMIVGVSIKNLNMRDLEEDLKSLKDPLLLMRKRKVNQRSQNQIGGENQKGWNTLRKTLMKAALHLIAAGLVRSPDTKGDLGPAQDLLVEVIEDEVG